MSSLSKEDLIHSEAYAAFNIFCIIKMSLN